MFIVLVAGLPAAGKSSFTAYLSRKLHIASFAMEKAQETLFDTIGFSSPEGKEKLAKASFALMLNTAENCMNAQIPLILEANFTSDMEKPLTELTEQYGYDHVTIHFGGNHEALYGRYVFRHSSPSRHRGHVCRQYYPELEGQEQDTAPRSYEEFCAEVAAGGMETFSIGGEQIHVDTTDFGSISYDELVERIRRIAQVYS